MIHRYGDRGNRTKPKIYSPSQRWEDRVFLEGQIHFISPSTHSFCPLVNSLPLFVPQFDHKHGSLVINFMVFFKFLRDR
jgi:hypothetical protein